MDTPGIRDLVVGLVAVADAYRAGPSATTTAIAVGCAGGRHRAATVASALAAVLAGDAIQADACGLAAVADARHGVPVNLRHRDMALPVVNR
jgi:UPF0042 nucleotide-binding protein